MPQRKSIRQCSDQIKTILEKEGLGEEVYEMRKKKVCGAGLRAQFYPAFQCRGIFAILQWRDSHRALLKVKKHLFCYLGAALQLHWCCKVG